MSRVKELSNLNGYLEKENRKKKYFSTIKPSCVEVMTREDRLKKPLASDAP